MKNTMNLNSNISRIYHNKTTADSKTLQTLSTAQIQHGSNLQCFRKTIQEISFTKTSYLAAPKPGRLRDSLRLWKDIHQSNKRKHQNQVKEHVQELATEPN
ncbi:hypothetical protein Trydic_g2471 [Trypoxylus dichotomus]